MLYTVDANAKTRSGTNTRLTTRVAQASKTSRERRLNWIGLHEELVLRKWLRTDIKEKTREDDCKQDGKTRANET